MFSKIKKIKNNKTLINGSLFSIYSLFNQGVSFLLLILLAGYIEPAQYGKLSLFNTIVQFLGYFIAFSTQGYLSVSYFQRAKQYFSKDFSTICLISLIVTIFIFLLLCTFGNILSSLADLPEIFLWIAVIISLFQIIWSMLLDYYRILEIVGKYGLYSCAFVILNFVLSIYLVIFKEQDWEGRIYAQLICTIIFGIIAIFVFAKHSLFTLKINLADAKTILFWGIPLIPHLASIWIKQGGDRFIINHYHTIEDVGIFSFALNLASIIFMIGSAFNATNSVSIYQVLSSDYNPSEKKIALKKQTKTTMLIYILATIFVVTMVSLFIPLLLPKYSPAIPYFFILSIQGLGQCFYFLFCNYLFYYHKNKYIMYVTFGTAILHLILSLILTKYSLYYTCILYVGIQFLIVALIYNLAKQRPVNK